MLAYSLKNVLNLLPKAGELVKSASIQEEYPTDSRDSILASALAINYAKHISRDSVDYDAMEKVARAVDIYELKDEVESLTAQMVKAAQAKNVGILLSSEAHFQTKLASFEDSLCGFAEISDIASRAEGLQKEASDRGYQVTDSVKRYSGTGFFSKEAAFKALSNRYHATGHSTFVKLAQAVDRVDYDTLKQATVTDLCRAVTQLDKEAGLTNKGYNFYNETIFTKEAAFASSLNVSLDGKQIPYEKIQALGKDRISSYVGADVAAELDRGPAHFKQVLETLPRDLQKLVVRLTGYV